MTPVTPFYSAALRVDDGGIADLMLGESAGAGRRAEGADAMEVSRQPASL